MSERYSAVFLFRWDDGSAEREASKVAFGEQRWIKSHKASSVIGVATRTPRDPFAYHRGDIEEEPEVKAAFVEDIEDAAVDVRWFDDPLATADDLTLLTDGGEP